MLKECGDNWGADSLSERLNEAVKFNQLIWSIFQAELAKEDNPLPKRLREDILNLSIFMDKRMFDIIAYPAPEKLKILIDINLNLAAGLRSAPSDKNK